MAKNIHIKKTNKLFSPLRFSLLLFVFLTLSFTTVFLSSGSIASGAGVPHNDGGEQIWPGGVLPIRGVSSTGEVCQFKNTSGDLTYFIPTRSQLEWTAVKEAASTGTHDLRLHHYDLGFSTLDACGNDCEFPNGEFHLHGNFVSGFSQSSVQCGSCPTANRLCDNGSLVGNLFHSCSAGICPPDHYCLGNDCYPEGEPCTAATCSSKTLLAQENDGRNCGDHLSDGCGGYINCRTNCASGEVCASCPPGGDDKSCYMVQPEVPTQGYCRQDTGCIGVVDVNHTTGRGRVFCIVTHEGEECPYYINTFGGGAHPVRYIDDNCEYYYQASWHACSNFNIPGHPPETYYVTFDDVNTEQSFYAYHSAPSQYEIIGSACYATTPPPPGGNGGGGNGEQEQQ